MADDLVISTLLRLQDQLSGPLAKLQEQLDRFRRAAQGVALPGLTPAVEQIDRAVHATQDWARSWTELAGVDIGRSIRPATAAVIEGRNATEAWAEALGQVNQTAERTSSTVDHIVQQLRQAGSAVSTGIGNALRNIGQHMGGMFGAGGEGGEDEERGGNGRRRGRWRDGANAVAGIGGGAALLGGIREYAEYENIIRHMGITQGLHGAALDADIAHWTSVLNGDALNTGQSSMGLAHAATGLITQHIPPAVVEQLMHAHSVAATAYNVDPDAMGQAMGALYTNFGIAPDQMEGALGAMAVAAKQAHFDVGSMSKYLPQITGQLSSWGMHGRGAADSIFAGLEVAIRTAQDPAQAATNYTDLISYMGSGFAARSFGKAGIDLHAITHRAVQNGKNPLDAVLDELANKTKGMSPDEVSNYIGKAIHNQQARMAVIALLQHRDEYDRIKTLLDKVSGDVVHADFAEAMRDPIIQVRVFSELVTQLGRRLGEGFTPVLYRINEGLQLLAQGFDRMNTHFPRATGVVLEAVGGFLALAAVVGVVSFVLPAIVTTVQLLAGVLVAILSPIGLVVAAIGAAAYLIYEHWDGVVWFFQELWREVQQVFQRFVDWVDSWSGGAMTAAINGIKSDWSQMTAYFEALIRSWEKPFEDFAAKIENSAVGRLLGYGHAAPLPQLAVPGSNAATGGAPMPVIDGMPAFGVGVDQNTAATNANTAALNAHAAALNAQTGRPAAGAPAPAAPNTGVQTTRP